MEQRDRQQTITTPAAHGLRAGTLLDVRTVGVGRWARARELLLRPRVVEVVATTQTTITTQRRRMTWAEWRRAWWRWARCGV